MRSKFGPIKIAGCIFLLNLGSSIWAQDSVGDDSTVRYPAAYFEEWAPVTAQDMMDRIPGLSSGVVVVEALVEVAVVADLVEVAALVEVEAAAEGDAVLVVVVAAARSSLTASAQRARITAPAVSWVLSRRIRSITSRSYAALPAS